MTDRRFLWLGALAFSFLLSAGTTSQAAYSYSTAITVTGSSVGGGTITPGATGSTYTLGGNTVTLGNIPSTGPFNGPLSPNTGTIGLTSTNTGAPQTFTLTYTDVMTINNPSGSAFTGTFTVTGNLTFTNVTANEAAVTNVFSGSLQQNQTIGGGGFAVSFGNGTQNDLFSSPTLNGSLGSMSAEINTVPEPASIVLMGGGLLGVLGIGLHRWIKARQA